MTARDQLTQCAYPVTPAHLSTFKQHHQQTEAQAGVLFTSKRRSNYRNMSGFHENPFVDAVEVNPFQGTHTGTTIPISAASSQPAVLQASAVEPTPQANLLRQQEELEKKAAELDRKEQELQNRPGGPITKENNWPPLPKFCPIKPCFYQDFNEDIPEDVTLFLNFLACLAYFTADQNAGVDFGLSILWFILFTPVSFICWYRPVSDSSFSFFFFFFVFFFQVSVYVIQCVGIPKWGNSGWISSITMIRSNVAVAVIMMVVAGCFTVNAVLAIILLKMVHSKYRRTGANFAKAQQEFSSGVLTNQTFQSAAASAASSAAQGAFQGR
ncbi:unnamed protein product [Coregonus sp. 'balchen']|nr:unnamed protein product [Coregonus sp. 'balchen']